MGGVMKVALIVGVALLTAACVTTGETGGHNAAPVPSPAEQSSVALTSFLDVYKKHGNKPLDACGTLEWLEETGAQGVPAAQAFVAVTYAFDITSCGSVVMGDPQNDVRAYAWLTDDAVAVLRNMNQRDKTAFLLGMTVPPKVADPGVQEVLNEMYAEERSGITNLNHLRRWVRSRMTVAQVEDALTLRAGLIR